ncbi:hypothetical protein L9F63_015586 [Diploptera punctata]|uniref:Uncharacterized protein n=1 Tax=Diploptera punctata TaxID=6984 RepID=A0AAD8A7C1_DIPPU|nr:hypothetical protein L9F63_015586 [Diploptera punctata]
MKKNSSIKNEETLNVLIVGMDSVSRINLHRQMPKTINVLENMDAIELLGYNKVADNTFLNLVPVLSGLTESELSQTSCWFKNTTFDKCNWIWKNFKEIGFRTAFGEDTSEFGLFTYMKLGFQEQPTDYYIRTIMRTSEEDIGYKKDPYARVCLGSEMTYVALLRYIKNYALTMSFKESFAFFWVTSLTHDYLNYPSLGDDKFAEFFNQLIDSGSLNRTLLIFMSDHGIRWGDIRETYQGRLEERLPFVFFVFPDWFKEQYPAAIANLRKNKYRLTTPFDIYKTLYDIVDLKQLEQETILKRSKDLSEMEPKPRAISLFLSVPKNRNCEVAGIEKHWCTCQKSEPLPIEDPIAMKMSLVLVEYLNNMLKPYGLCSELKYAELKSANVQFPLEDMAQKITDKGLKDYVIVTRTTPGDALFEATIRHYLGNNTVNVIGTVSRINSYGSQSMCVTDYHVKPYCFCSSFLNSTSK